MLSVVVASYMPSNSIITNTAVSLRSLYLSGIEGTCSIHIHQLYGSEVSYQPIYQGNRTSYECGGYRTQRERQQENSSVSQGVCRVPDCSQLILFYTEVQLYVFVCLPLLIVILVRYTNVSV